MSKRLKVLLLEDVESLGKAGDIVTVAEGQARNKLFPEGLAALATPETEKAHKQKANVEEVAKDEELTKLQKQADKLDATELILQVKVKENDELYGSVTAKDIVKELNSQINLKLKPDQVVGELPIKRIGTYDISINLSSDANFIMHLSVEPDTASKTKAAEDE